MYKIITQSSDTIAQSSGVTRRGLPRHEYYHGDSHAISETLFLSILLRADIHTGSGGGFSSVMLLNDSTVIQIQVSLKTPSITVVLNKTENINKSRG